MTDSMKALRLMRGASSCLSNAFIQNINPFYVCAGEYMKI